MDRSAEVAGAPGCVTAPLRYLIDTGEKPVFYASVGGGEDTRHTARFEDRPVAIHDGRGLGEGMSLDREGFLLVRHETAVADFYGEAGFEAVYDPEIQDLVKRATGAKRVEIFDHTLRADDLAMREQKKVREPAWFVHNDYTARSAPKRLRDHFPAEEAEALLERRFAVINVWRPIGQPVRTTPLAICDARSIKPADLIVSERRAKERVGEVQQAIFSPDHRWYYFPAMRRDEALLIKVFDSAEDGRARFTIHAAFEDPTAPPDAPPRESIETRTFAFF